MRNVDVIFLHPGPDDCIMPLASVALMNLLLKNGFEVEGLNEGLERTLEKTFDVSGWLKNREYHSVVIDLHFNGHSFDALRLAAVCKKSIQTPLLFSEGSPRRIFAKKYCRAFRRLMLLSKATLRNLF